MPVVLVGPGALRGKPGPWREILTSAGFELIEPPARDALTESQLREHLPNADAMLVGGEVLDGPLFDLAPRLRVVARVGVGYDLVDIDAATARSIAVTITPGTNHGSVAEQAFALLLAVTRKIPVYDAEIRRGGWVRTGIRPLRGQTLGLLGLGRIGKAVATRALAFEMNVISHDPLSDGRFEVEHGLRSVGFEEILTESEIVSLHLPLNHTTRGMFNRDLFARMRPGSILINTARGGLIQEADLYEALTSGHLAGAGLDVFVQEPPDSENPLLTLPNVVLSPHVAGIDSKSLSDMAALAATCIVEMTNGTWPEECIVNRELIGRPMRVG